MEDFTGKLNKIIAEAYHNVLLMEETKRKYSKASFSFRDRNAIAFLLRYENGRTVSELADYLKISRPSASTLVKKLERHGLVRRSAQPGNDRNTRVIVTRKGKMFSSYQRQYRELLAERTSEGFTDEEKEVLYRGLCQMNEFFIESINDTLDHHK